MRNLSLAAFLAFALCACGGGGADTAAVPPGTQPPGTQPPGTQPPGTQPPGTQPPGTPPPTAGSATLAWNANTESDVNGYRVYYGTSSGNYIQGTAQGINAGNATTFVVNNLTRGQRYFFVVTAYDTSGNESPFSLEQSKLIP